jgi:hypothetical protein
MSFWKNLFGRKKEMPKPAVAPPAQTLAASFQKIKQPEGFPLTVTLAVGTNELKATLFIHQVATNQGYINCLSYLTIGFQALGQPELLLTIPNDEQLMKDFQKPLVTLAALFDLVSVKKQSIRNGFAIKIGKNGYLGWEGVLLKELSSTLVTEIEVPAGTLAIIMLDATEIATLPRFGTLRTLSLLGQTHRYYPFPYWSDTKRPRLPIALMAQSSILNKVTVALPAQFMTATLEDNKIIVRILSNITFFQEGYAFPQKAVVAFLTSLDPQTDGCLSWTHNNELCAITPEGSTGKKIGGCFLALLPEQKANSAKTVEDGFVLSMTNTAWTDLWQALKDKKSFSIHSDDQSVDLVLEWV